MAYAGEKITRMMYKGNEVFNSAGPEVATPTQAVDKVVDGSASVDGSLIADLDGLRSIYLKARPEVPSWSSLGSGSTLLANLKSMKDDILAYPALFSEYIGKTFTITFPNIAYNTYYQNATSPSSTQTGSKSVTVMLIGIGEDKDSSDNPLLTFGVCNAINVSFYKENTSDRPFFKESTFAKAQPSSLGGVSIVKPVHVMKGIAGTIVEEDSYFWMPTSKQLFGSLSVGASNSSTGTKDVSFMIGRKYSGSDLYIGNLGGVYGTTYQPYGLIVSDYCMAKNTTYRPLVPFELRFTKPTIESSGAYTVTNLNLSTYYPKDSPLVSLYVNDASSAYNGLTRTALLLFCI